MLDNLTSLTLDNQLNLNVVDRLNQRIQKKFTLLKDIYYINALILLVIRNSTHDNIKLKKRKKNFFHANVFFCLIIIIQIIINQLDFFIKQ